MKKLTAILLCAAMLFTLTACAGAKGEPESALIECETEFIYISYQENLPEVPVVKMIGAKNEFDALYNEIDEHYYNDDLKLVHLCKKYTEEFFDDKAVVFTIFYEGSSSHSFYLDSLIKGADGKLYVNIEDARKNSVMTDNFGTWCAFIEIEKQHLPENVDDIVILQSKGWL